MQCRHQSPEESILPRYTLALASFFIAPESMLHRSQTFSIGKMTTAHEIALAHKDIGRGDEFTNHHCMTQVLSTLSNCVARLTPGEVLSLAVLARVK